MKGILWAATKGRYAIAAAIFWFSLNCADSYAQESAGWKKQWDTTIAGAKKEGRLMLWGDMEITHPDIIAAFNERYPFIRVVTVTGKVEDLLPRIIAERRAEKYLADLYSGGIGSGRIFYNLHGAGALEPIRSTLILPEVTEGKHWLGGKQHYADSEAEYVFMFEGTLTSVGAFYNRDLINLKEFNSYWNLLDPKWKGKIVVYDPANAGISSFISYYYNPKLGPEFVRKLMGEMEPVESRNRRQATDWLASGTFPLCISCRDVDAAKRKGLAVDEFNRDQLKESGTEIGVSGNSGLVLINKAPHPNAATVFINWYLSREGQMVWQRVMNKQVIEATESMRVDIPKDDVPPEHRRSPDKEYRVSGFQDRAPVLKMIKEALESGGVKRSKEK